MALSMKQRMGGPPVKSFAREEALYAFNFTAANPVVASTIQQAEAVVASVVRSAQGKYTVTLGPRFKFVRAWAQARNTAQRMCTVDAIVQGGTAANTVSVSTFTVAGGATAQDTTDVIDVFMVLTTAGQGL